MCKSCVVQITCSTPGVHHTTCSVPRDTKGQFSCLVWQSWNRIYFSFILWAGTTNRWRRRGNQCTRRKPLTTSLIKCHILKPADSSPIWNSNLHSRNGGRHANHCTTCRTILKWLSPFVQVYFTLVCIWSFWWKCLCGEWAVVALWWDVCLRAEVRRCQPTVLSPGGLVRCLLESGGQEMPAHRPQSSLTTDWRSGSLQATLPDTWSYWPVHPLHRTAGVWEAIGAGLYTHCIEQLMCGRL